MTRRIVFLCAWLLVAAAAPERWIGVWKLNLAKSRYQSGTLPKSRVLSFEEIGGSLKGTSDLLDEVGSVHIEFTARYDGKDVPLRGPTPPATTIAFLKGDGSTFDILQKTNGHITISTHFTVSRDGKTLTASAVGTDPQGAKFTNVSVYDRQP